MDDREAFEHYKPENREPAPGEPRAKPPEPRDELRHYVGTPGRIDRFLSASWQAVRNEYRLQWTENKAGLAMALGFLIAIGLLTLAALTR